MKVVLIIGTRPEIIKSSIISNLFLKEKWTEFEYWDTGQHYDYNLAKIFIDELGGVKPTVNMNIRSGSHARQLSRIMIKTEKELCRHKPDLVIVIGDTNSTLGVTLASRKLYIPVAHIEAGPREHFFDGVRMFRDKRMMNLPEEVNRTIVDQCSELLFAPTKNSMRQLKAEGVLGDAYLTGDISYDILRKYLPKIKQVPTLKNMGLKKGFNLVTLHRAENTDNPKKLKGIVQAFEESKTRIVFPMHPRVRGSFRRIGKINQLIKNPLIHICEPLGFFDFINLLRNSGKVFTDSGGVQMQSLILKKPCVTMRETTGWVETVQLGVNKLVGANKKLILKELTTRSKVPNVRCPFGNGKASEQIIKIIRDWALKNHKI